MSISVIFDMDGTLFQTNKILEISLEETFSYLRTMKLWDKETPVQKYRNIMGVPLSVVWETLLPNHTSDIRERANIIFHEKLIENIIKGKGALYPFVEEIFQYLKEQGANIYIASNGQVEYLETIIQKYELHKWVTETFSIQQIESQSKIDLVHNIIQKYGIEEGMMVGDRLSDIQAGKMNGLVAIGCNFDFAQEDELSHADFIIDCLSDLRSIFQTFAVNLIN